MAVVRTCAQHASSLSLCLSPSLSFSLFLFRPLSPIFPYSLYYFPFFSLIFITVPIPSLLSITHTFYLSPFSFFLLSPIYRLPSQFLLALLLPCHYLFPFTFLSLSLSRPRSNRVLHHKPTLYSPPTHASTCTNHSYAWASLRMYTHLGISACSQRKFCARAGLATRYTFCSQIFANISLIGTRLILEEISCMIRRNV